MSYSLLVALLGFGYFCVTYFNAKKSTKAIIDNQEISHENQKNIENLLLQLQNEDNTDDGDIKESLNNAIAVETKYIDGNKDDYNGYRNRGRAFLALKRYSDAIKDFVKAIELNPNDVGLLNYRANAYKNVGTKESYEMAINDYSSIVDIDSTQVKAYFNRGYIYLKIERFDSALIDMNNFISNTIDNKSNYLEKAYNYLGIAHKNLGEFDSSVTAFSNAMNLNPERHEYIGNRAFAYLKLKDFDKAISDYTTAIEKNPNEPDYYKYRANAYKNTNRPNLEKIDTDKYYTMKSK